MENPFLLHQLGEWYERGQYLDGDQEIAQRRYFERSLDRFLEKMCMSWMNPKIQNGKNFICRSMSNTRSESNMTVDGERNETM